MHDNDLLGGAVLLANLTTVCLQVKDCCYKQCEIGSFQPPDIVLQSYEWLVIVLSSIKNEKIDFC